MKTVKACKLTIFTNMECLKKTVKSQKVQDLFHLPNSFLDYDELEVIITPIISNDLSERKKLAKRDIDIINANTDRLNKDAEENLSFQALL